MSSVGSGRAGPDVRPVARKTTPSSSEIELVSECRSMRRQVVATYPVSSASSRLAPTSSSSPSGTPPSGISHEYRSSV